MRAAIAVAATLVSGSAVTVAATGWQVPETYRWPLALLALGSGIVAAAAAFGPRTESTPLTTAETKGLASPVTQAQGDIVVGTQYKAGRDQHIHYGAHRTDSDHAQVTVECLGGNTVSEKWARWFQVRARTTTDVLAKGANVHVKVLALNPEPWCWSSGERREDIGQQGCVVPVVVMALAWGGRMNNRWSLAHKHWYKTPDDSRQLGTDLGELVEFDFEVTVSWPEGSREAWTRARFHVSWDGAQPECAKVGEDSSSDVSKVGLPGTGGPRGWRAFVIYKGTVTDWDTRVPIPGVCVYPGTRVIGCPPSAERTGDDGTYMLSLPFERSYEINFEHPDYEAITRRTDGVSFSVHGDIMSAVVDAALLRKVRSPEVRPASR